MSAWAGLALAMALLPAGDPGRAAASLVRHAGGEKLEAIPAGWRGVGFEALVRCRLALGERDAARRSLILAELTAARRRAPDGNSLGSPRRGGRRAGCR